MVITTQNKKSSKYKYTIVIKRTFENALKQVNDAKFQIRQSHKVGGQCSSIIYVETFHCHTIITFFIFVFLQKSALFVYSCEIPYFLIFFSILMLC